MLKCSKCGDRAFRLLTWMGYELSGKQGDLIWKNARGRVAIRMDLKLHPTRTTIIAVLVRLCL